MLTEEDLFLEGVAERVRQLIMRPASQVAADTLKAACAEQRAAMEQQDIHRFKRAKAEILRLMKVLQVNPKFP